MFPVKDIKTALNIKPAISREMVIAIDKWIDCYCGRAGWLNDNICSLGLEKAITREFADVCLNEMTATVANNDTLNKLISNVKTSLNKNFRRGLATGGLVMKPIGKTKFQCVSADRFIPVEFDSEGRLIKVVFPDCKKIGSNYYTRLEYHNLGEETGLTITNTVFVSADKNHLGKETSLDVVEEWKDLPRGVTYPKMRRPAYGYYVNPVDNTVDDSPCGISIFDSALELIQKADIQFGRLDWEFESGERAIHVDIAAVEKDDSIAKHNKRLYKALDIESKDGELFKEFSPEFRESELIAGLEEYKRNIEFSVGLAYGDLSRSDDVEKTATEIKASKVRKYNTVTAIQENLKSCLDDFVYAVAFYNSMTLSGYEFICDFKDSILTDEETEREQDRKDLANGTLRPEEYRAKWRSEDVETAKKNLPKQSEVID